VLVDLVRAEIVQRLAFSTAIRGVSNVAIRLQQAEAVSTVTHAALRLQDKTVNNVYYGMPVDAGTSQVSSSTSPTPRTALGPVTSHRPLKIHVLHGQWDETSQRIKAFLLNHLPGEIASGRLSGVQTMMSHFMMFTLVDDKITFQQPLFCAGVDPFSPHDGLLDRGRPSEGPLAHRRYPEDVYDGGGVRLPHVSSLR